MRIAGAAAPTPEYDPSGAASRSAPATSGAQHVQPAADSEVYAAGEAAIGLAILVIYFRGRGTIAVDDVNRMKG